MVDMDIELTSVETVSQRGQSGIPNGDGEDKLSIKPSLVFLDEHNLQHILPSNIPESSSKILTSSVVGHSVERLSKNEAEELITLPSAKLEEWQKMAFKFYEKAGEERRLPVLIQNMKHHQPNDEISSSQVRVSGSQSDRQIRQQYSNNSIQQCRDQPWLTTAHGEIVNMILDTARRDPCHFRETSADSPVNFTIDTDELRGFPENTTYDLWEKYYKELFLVDGTIDVSRRQWTLTLRKAWLRRRLIAIRASKDSVIVGICCAELLCKYDSGSSERTVGSVLEFCYDSGALRREIETVSEPFSIQPKFQEWIRYIDVEDVLALQLPELMIIIYLCTQQINPPADTLESPPAKLLRIDDLNAETLQSYSMIKWDMFSPEQTSRSILSNEFGLNHSIRRTWFMLYTASKDPKRFHRLISTRIGEPMAKMWKDTDSITSSEHTLLDWYHNCESSKIESAARNKSEIPCNCFGRFENRVRILREYMDKQKRRGLRQLWMDSRDSFNYYTFWGVIIFGTVSVFLAMASLAVSIAQTYASFKALG
ncbi:hypothetical protein BTUL_0093g00170 [Botrytis tulipae]|uniref:Uncharacterized protein n=1 Tax=Botrytis tulipae TaxID=87230 RepID=A0A4Z1ELW2_9HELO|nr:hypothetical protein BTUL_0093g00170 [Botrytis tulipae]